jgi:hypothetical protein
MRVWPTACVVALLAAGCGGGQETAVREAAQRWLDAVAQHDDAAACAQQSARLNAAIERHLLGEGVAGSCRTWAARWVSPRYPASHRGARITAVRISGMRARIGLAAPGAVPADAKLVRERGRWRVDDF